MYRVDQKNGRYDLIRVNSSGKEQHLKNVSTELEALQSGLDLANYDLQMAALDYQELKTQIHKD